MSKFKQKLLYETSVINEDGVEGISYVNRKDGLRVVVSHPTNDQPGTNPEELFALAQATCLNATIKELLGKKTVDHPSRVRVDVAFMREAEKPGFYFQVDVFVAVKNMADEEVEALAHRAESFCPVSKLVADSDTVSLNIESYE